MEEDYYLKPFSTKKLHLMFIYSELVLRQNTDHIAQMKEGILMDRLRLKNVNKLVHTSTMIYKM
jgi:hypothetical protein